ncbi:sugar kinase [Brachybacterium fresconis]|uniref:2-dehydro-3-deoxygluconokinase n=1 Tax=Brachybacterium fresconis TaxID=173363 RepID=A0ABS4YLV8_9MICO|nr:sugar kinase [Brachybacterium fresconis]MBP2409781.1 2-dehydro-3-deoxygluconokinase [Brachybacterium fresconis]
MSTEAGVADATTTGSGPRVVAIGETMAMMRSGTIGSLAHLPSVDISLGGAESNLAIGLRRLDVPVAWVSRVGDDPLGTRVTREIRAEGVEVHCAIDPTRPTGLMVKSRPTGTTTRVDYYRAGSAASALTADDLPAGLIEQADILHLSGITPLLSPTAHATNVAAVQRAAAAETLVSLDVNYRSRLGSREHLAELLGEILEHVDVLFGGPEELSILAPGVAEDDHRGLLRSLAVDGRQVVAKLGADGGAALVGAGTGPAGDGTAPADPEIIVAPGHRVDVVDTVGAGDAFVAGYLSAQLDGLDVPARLARANACGALACTTPGDWEGAPRRPDLDGMLAGGGADPVSR